MAANSIEILLVEDNAKDEMLTLHAFERQQITNKVHVARDGVEALECIFCTGAHADRTIGHPIVILLDMKMPVLDGLEVLRRVRADPRTRMIPVVALTGSQDEDELMELYRLGVNGCISKGSSFEQFDEVARHVGHYCRLLDLQPAPTPPLSLDISTNAVKA